MQAAVARTGSDARPRRLWGWIIAVFGLLFLILGVAAGVLHQRDLAAYTGRATGVVVDVLVTRSSGRASKRAYTPVVRFMTAAGEPEQFTSTLATNPPRFTIGQQVTVAYDPANPSQATIDSFWDSWYLTLVMGGPGLLFFLLGLLAARGQFFRQTT